MLLHTDRSGLRVRAINSNFASYFSVSKEEATGQPLVAVDRIPYAPGILANLIGYARQNPDQMVESEHESTNALTNRPRHLVFRAFANSNGCTVTIVDETRMRTLEDYFARYVSPHLLEQLVNAPQDFFSCRNVEVSVIAARLAGFEDRIAHLSAEQAVALLSPFYSTMIDAAHAYGGLVDVLHGGLVVVVFGAPLFVDDHILRACLCTQQMVALGESRREAWAGSGLESHPCGIGIGTGPCLAGNLGDSRRAEYTTLGRAVTLAERLADGAPPDQVLVGRDVVEALKVLHEARKPEGIPKVALRGFSRMIEGGAYGPLKAYVMERVGSTKSSG